MKERYDELIKIINEARRRNVEIYERTVNDVILEPKIAINPITTFIT